ncbi:hypothetical protein NAP1_09792 [Erythrobacter sp. NAP1]|uniref:TIR domain-containing protein n=1 Tax=Erythrobacter sp. NAP1 TaxID=237727 RepID=UPI00006851AA|nr:TIR domain-containing protein [Erythrobacter sp. NAP1]EAQ27877.1 hypothetical protein NAP1_09792 [Erythrobacter sp. NAP1]
MAGLDAADEARHSPRPKLFLSYTRADIDQAGNLRKILEANGFEVWWDQLLEGGVNYLPTTEAALEGADCVVVLWTERSVDSSWVRDEAQRGRERGCLVPVTLDGTMSPLGFRQIQLLDMSNWSGASDAPEITKLVNAINGQVAANAGESGMAAPKASPAPISSVSSAPAKEGVSRRALMTAGAGVLGAGAVFAAWQQGLFSSGDGDAFLSMAVLRFANLTGGEDQIWFSDGLSNELRQALSRNPRLRVSAPTSSNASDGDDDFAIGLALGVSSILRGNVQQVGETVRIYAELLEVDGGVVQWSESYDRNFSDVLGLQKEIAAAVALSLVARIASDRAARSSVEEQEGVGGTEDVRAYEAFLRGEALYALGPGEEIKRSALDQYDVAIGFDPQYAAAHARRANTLAAIANSASDPDEVGRLFDQSIEAARRAIEIAPDYAKGHLALGYVLNFGRMDRAGAYPHYKRAEELAPGDADTMRSVATFYSFGNQRALAMQMIERVVELDPLNALAFRSAGFVALFAGAFDQAIAYMEKALELNPSLANSFYAIGAAKLALGDDVGARDAFEAEAIDLFALPGLAIARRRLGDEAGASEAFSKLVSDYGDSGLYQQAQVLAQWGESERALAVLTRAFDKGDPGVLLTTNDPLLDPLRGEPGLDRLLLRLSS